MNRRAFLPALAALVAAPIAVARRLSDEAPEAEAHIKFDGTRAALRDERGRETPLAAWSLQVERGPYQDFTIRYD